MKPARFKSWEAWDAKQIFLAQVPKSTEEQGEAATLLIEELRLRGHGVDGDPVRETLSYPEIYLVLGDRLVRAGLRASRHPTEVRPDELSVLARALVLAYHAMSSEERAERGLP